MLPRKGPIAGVAAGIRRRARAEALEEAAAVIERSPTWDKHSERGSLCWCELCTYVRGNASEIRSLAAASKAAGGGQ